jgi:hypothetical protein
MPDVWQNLRPGDGLRVSTEGKFDFFWAVLEQNTVAMILRLPEGVDCTLAVPKFKSLEVNFRQLDKMSLVMRLLDDTQRDLFHTLCEDVVLAAEQGQDLDDAVARAIRRTRRWSFLLRGGSQKGLSVEEQRGLVGELAFLAEIKTKLGAAAAIEAWKGPEGSPKDFEFPGLCVEVKARRGAAKPLVRISSEDQLADVDGTDLFLRVYDVDSSIAPEGQTLHDIVAYAQLQFSDDQTAFDRWQDLLDATGYDLNAEYSERRWVVGLARTYSITEDFPRIAGTMPIGVSDVGYSIDLEACEPFQCEAIDYRNIYGGKHIG